MSGHVPKFMLNMLIHAGIFSDSDGLGQISNEPHFISFQFHLESSISYLTFISFVISKYNFDRYGMQY